MSIQNLFSAPIRWYVTVLCACVMLQGLDAQIPGGGRENMNPAQFNIGRFYGKIVDDGTGKPLAYATVQLYGMRFDSVTRSKKEAMLGGQLTQENGEFSLEKLPTRGEFTLKVSFMGYASIEKKVSFGTPGGAPTSGQRPNGMSAGAFDKDLGNIRLGVSSQLLKEVTIEGSSGQVTLALDKKIYRVDKDGVAAGGTAEDAMKNIPSLNVDIDGNLTMRSASPQIFVDGRPTNLSLDQIPADAIDNVEVITNPSAKYDASGGNAGIVNIVLKKDRRIGYSGGVRGGVDMRGRFNLGGDINAREGKINTFLSGNFNQRRSIGTGGTDRQNLFGSPLTNVYQTNASQNDGFFAMGRAGMDWFINNRNTLTLAGSLNGGHYNSVDVLNIQTDTLHAPDLFTSYSIRHSESGRNHRTYGSQLLYKHLFPKEGREWTADLNFNGSNSNSEGNFKTTYFGQSLETRQRQDGNGSNELFTVQTDLVNPLRGGMKMEVGGRAAIRNYRSDNFSFQYVNNEPVRVPGVADRYKYNDQVYAAYTTFSKSFPKWGFQGGLRAESSSYTGVLLDNDSTFTNEYPLSLFPSAFFTYKVNDEDNIQLSYSRRINRPGFFQLIPFPDFSDSLLLSRGNPGLKPEFTNSLELSYQNILGGGHNVLASAYFKRATNLVTRYQYSEYNAFLERDVIISTYANSNSSYAYGLELTVKNTFFKKVELTSNVNLYNSVVDAQNIEKDLRTEQFTWFVKENLNIKFPAAFTLQLSGSYQSRTSFSMDSGGGGRHGGGMGWGGTSNTAQGYTIPVWYTDLSIRKDLWKKTANITLSMQDIFRSRRSGAHSESLFFIQDNWRRRDPQLVRLNFSYRFGKFDTSLFRRKNTRVETEGMDF